MKRFWMTLLTAGLALALAAPALAAKPDKPGKPGPSEDPPVAPCVAVKTLENIKGTFDYDCEWTPVDGDPRPDVGLVTVRVDQGEVTDVVMIVNDSYPGDLCLYQPEWLDERTGESLMPLEPGESVTGAFPLVFEGEAYWDSPENWCSRFDEYGPKEDLNGDPLHLKVQLRARRGTIVIVTLDP
jgi:hypothetical protein